jgi:hypothetical protein
MRLIAVASSLATATLAAKGSVDHACIQYKDVAGLS